MSNIVCYSNEIMWLLKLYFFVSPFVILYYYRKSKNTSNLKIRIPLDAVQDALSENIDEDYLKLLAAYGSIQGYEDAMMKDFNIMREYLKKVLLTLHSASNSLKKFSVDINDMPNISSETMKQLMLKNMTFIIEDFEKCAINLENFIKSEEHAHTASHDVDEIKERRNKDEEDK